jgi:poly(hydroxyalkanoate) depolymerase family esterase
MTISNKLFAQMRAATRSLFRRGPSVARSVIKESIRNATALRPGAGKAMPYDRFNAASNQASKDPFSDMLAGLNRIGQPGGNPFDVPPLTGGVGAPGLPGHVLEGSHSNAAGTRHYKLYVPSTYTGGAPPGQPSALLVMLHGCSQNPDDFALGTGMNALAEECNCLVVYPAQSKGANPSRCWNWFNAVDQKHGQGEPSIIAGITEDVMARYVIDPGQVYVAGLSAGGAMAAIMGTLYSELYAAVGVHSGLPFAAAHDLPSAVAAMKGDFRRPKNPARGIPIIVFHGDRDTTVHPANGDELVHRRRRQPHSAVEVEIEPGQVPQGHAYTRTLHRRADGSIDAEHWVVHGSGHAWSGGDARGTYTDGKGPSASRAMMRFFRTAR